ncbi:flagellar hook-basal body complex protein [Thalassospiraceae bacterium LMO-JJ14]|nr:flagellar hook-basal body complex protein [Thalassospiraceae bacterium LMO-JJ14]
MSLFGALTSGVSGLTAQSSAIGAISDNITNVNTIGYKGTQVDFQTLVTVQTSGTFYSAGGVQSKPRQDTGVQGLLQSSTSQTDIAISGNGFFVVNESNSPTLSNEFLFTRAGSFYQDDQGFLRNTSGYYLQAWPTTAAGVVTTNNTALTIPNQNVISTDFLATVNLNRVGGTATATSNIGIGANLPSTDTQGTTHKTDVQFFDTLGNANTTSLTYAKGNRDNQWDVAITPPSGVNVVTLYSDTAGATVYESRGQLEFTGLPANDATMTITQNGTTITYQFDTTGAGVDTATVKQVDISAATTVAQAVAALVAKVKEADTNFADYGGFTNNRIQVNPGSSTGIYFTEDGSGAITVDPTGLLTSTGARATLQESSYTVKETATANRDYHQFTFGGLPADGDTVTINGTTYTFSTAEGAVSDNDTTIRRDSVANMLADLEASIEANDASFASGASSVRTRVNASQAEPPSTTADTLVLSTLSAGSYDVLFSAAFANIPTEPDGTATYVANTAHAVNKNQAIQFNSDGLPTSFAIAEMEIIGFANGAANMDDDASNSSRITLDLGRVGEANGFTQFGAEFTPGFITQNGSQFGTLAGVTIDESGLMTALFDNGETRPIFKIPIATFVNVNGLNARTGNVWNQTQASGDNTLREANNGTAGSVTQAALESSTVDIGAEFTKMIVVQRAYSAATKIISTADQMLEELVRIKR